MLPAAGDTAAGRQPEQWRSQGRLDRPSEAGALHLSACQWAGCRLGLGAGPATRPGVSPARLSINSQAFYIYEAYIYIYICCAVLAIAVNLQGMQTSTSSPALEGALAAVGANPIEVV